HYSLVMVCCSMIFFLFNHTATPEIYTLSLHDALPISVPYNVLPQLDINNTIDHRPEGDEKWFLENEKTVTQFCRKLAAERPLKRSEERFQQECRDRSRMPSSA